MLFPIGSIDSQRHNVQLPEPVCLLLKAASHSAGQLRPTVRCRTRNNEGLLHSTLMNAYSVILQQCDIAYCLKPVMDHMCCSSLSGISLPRREALMATQAFH